MPTSRHLPERTVNLAGWKIEELENEKGYHVITPEGYTFGFATKELLVRFVMDTVYGGIVYTTMYGDSHEVRDGIIYSWLSDPWINPGIEHGEKITDLPRLTNIILAYAISKWIN